MIKKRIVKYCTICSLVLLMLFSSCQKPADRTCFKSIGSYAELEFPLDSVRHFHLNRNIRYRIFQDDSRKVVVKGGENLIRQIDFDNRDNVLYIEDLNRCDVLRNESEPVEVEIHYPHLFSFYVDATDSVVFEGKIFEKELFIEMRDGGGSLSAFVDVHKISMVVSNGAGDFTLKGVADEAELKVQNNGSADASNFRSEYVFIYQNSTADLFIDLQGSSALIIVDGTGNVYYKNEPGNIESDGLGNGQILKL